MLKKDALDVENAPQFTMATSYRNRMIAIIQYLARRTHRSDTIQIKSFGFLRIGQQKNCASNGIKRLLSFKSFVLNAAAYDKR